MVSYLPVVGQFVRATLWTRESRTHEGTRADTASGKRLGLVTAWNYFAGWSYAYHYFDRFRIPLLMVDVPTEHVFVYGGLVIWKNWYWAILLAIVLLGLAWTCNR